MAAVQLHESSFTPDQLRAWDEDGYVIGETLLDAPAVEQLLERMERVFMGEYDKGTAPWEANWSPDDPPSALREVVNAWWADELLSTIILSRAIGAMAAQLTRTSSTRVFMDTLLHKPPAVDRTQRAAVVGWHQDWAYWRCASPANLLTARIALDRETLENGCMRVIPGSHRWALQEDIQQYHAQDADVESLPRFDVAPGTVVEPVPCVLEAGQVMFHHCMTMHASAPNYSDGPRRSILVQLLPEGTRYAEGTGCLPSLVSLVGDGEPKDGDAWEGPMFPVSYRA
jgi:ectoine hydroxylase-related dioxygenase (phytanoyl-CoA dioxygenase family)